MNFESLFDTVFCSAEMGVKKPQKEYYEYIIDTLNVDAHDIIYYDDALENIESASSLGVKAIHYKSIRNFSS